MALVKKHHPKDGPQRVRMYKGQKVTPTLYDGPEGKYMASIVNDQLLRNEITGRPIEFKNAGKLEWISPQL